MLISSIFFISDCNRDGPLEVAQMFDVGVPGPSGSKIVEDNIQRYLYGALHSSRDLRLPGS